MTRNGATHYERLGVGPSASVAEIRAAYRELARRYHPDANPSDGEATAAAMTAVNEAWYVLGDPRRRAEYDATIAPPARPRTPSGDRPRPTPASPRTWSAPPADPPRPSWWNEPLTDDPRLDVPITDGRVVRTFGVLVAVVAALALAAVTALFTYAILWSS